MAVEEHLLGQQVRCPHCQQVLVAPAACAPAAFESAGSQPADVANTTSVSANKPSDSPEFHPSETESIFAPPEHGSDDLFGVPTPAAMVEMPAEHGPAPFSPEAKNEDGTDKLISASTNGSGVRVKASSEALSPPASVESVGAGSDLHQATHAWPDLGASDFPAELPAEMSSPQLTQQVARRAKRESLFATYLIIILIPYAIFATCVAAYFYFRMKQMPHPLEYLRDSGENPPAKRGTSSVMETISPETNLPSRLMLALGQQFRLGDLEIQPVKVERRKLTICSENRQVRPQETSQDALVLTLRLKNVSQDVYFTPTDPVFERQWKLEFGSNRPYTLLDMGGTRFFGGPIKYMPRGHQGQFRGDDPREYVKGQEHDNQALKPGEERTSIICTDPNNREILKTLKSYQGPLVWRVQLRRGLVQIGEREVSATAVVGVVFDKKDIANGS
jgi:hypothetical protein